MVLITFISLLVGVVTAGTIWISWSLAEKMMAKRTAKKDSNS